MMSEAGYRWMTGGTASPGWMTGGSLPGMMMGGGSDPGKVMGSLWANAPGPRVSAAQAAALGRQVPAGAKVDKAAGTLTFSTATAALTIVASPAGGPDETFRAAGLTNPRIVVPAGARVSIQLVNADPDTAHGLVITAAGAAGSWMPMMTARPAFAGSALWFLGNPTSAGMHAGTLAFTATAAGSYQYLCPVPGHAQEGMAGAFIVRLRTAARPGLRATPGLTGRVEAEAAPLDGQAAVLDVQQPGAGGDRAGFRRLDAELQPERGGSRRDGLPRDVRRLPRWPEHVYKADLLGHLRQGPVGLLAEDLPAAQVDRDNPPAVALHQGGHAMRRLGRVGARADDRDRVVAGENPRHHVVHAGHNANAIF
jgi:rusticyanin